MRVERKRISFLFLIIVCIALNIEGQSIPPGAAALGYTNCVYNFVPTTAEIAPGINGSFIWFRGQFWEPMPAATNFTTVSNALVINFTGSNLDLVSEPRDFSTGSLPLLAGTNGFYVEFDVQLSDNNSDHWACVWLAAEEHGPNQTNGEYFDHYPGTPVGYEQFLELDVQESGFTPGLLGTVHNWTGIYPTMSSITNPNNASTNAINMSAKHTFGASYDPIHQKVSWWVDGVYQMSTTSPYVPAVASEQHFYLLISAYSHGKNVPYSMHVSGVRAYIGPPAPPISPSNLHVGTP